MLPAVQIEACTSRIRNQLVATSQESCASEIVAADELCAVLGYLRAIEKATPLGHLIKQCVITSRHHRTN